MKMCTQFYRWVLLHSLSKNNGRMLVNLFKQGVDVDLFKPMATKRPDRLEDLDLKGKFVIFSGS